MSDRREVRRCPDCGYRGQPAGKDRCRVCGAPLGDRRTTFRDRIIEKGEEEEHAEC